MTTGRESISQYVSTISLLYCSINQLILKISVPHVHVITLRWNVNLFQAYWYKRELQWFFSTGHVISCSCICFRNCREQQRRIREQIGSQRSNTSSVRESGKNALDTCLDSVPGLNLSLSHSIVDLLCIVVFIVMRKFKLFNIISTHTKQFKQKQFRTYKLHYWVFDLKFTPFDVIVTFNFHDLDYNADSLSVH